MVTVGQLLNHTAGVPDYFDEELESDYGALWRERPCYRMTSVRDFLPLFENAPMKAPPGQGFNYCNAGFVLLGLVIEDLTGRDFREVVAERIFGPCGMTHSGYFAMDALPDNTALGYLSEDEADRRTNIYSVPLIGGGDGGAFTTAQDMRRFWTALLAGRILARDWLDRFLAPSVQVAERDASWHYGRGVWLRQERGNWIVSVEGSDPGASMELQVWSQRGRDPDRAVQRPGWRIGRPSTTGRTTQRHLKATGGNRRPSRCLARSVGSGRRAISCSAAEFFHFGTPLWSLSGYLSQRVCLPLQPPIPSQGLVRDPARNRFQRPPAAGTAPAIVKREDDL